MTFRSSVLYALRLVLPRGGGDSGRGRKGLGGGMLSIGISLVPLVAVLSVSDGMIEGITGRIIGLSSQDISVRVPAAIPLRRLAEGLSGVEGVSRASAELQGIALAAGKSARTGVTVRAVPQDIFAENHAFATYFSVEEGGADLSGGRNAVIGQKVARDLSLHAGDKITLITASPAAGEGAAVRPKAAVFTVAGIVSCGYQELDALWVFIPFEAGEAFFPQAAVQRIVSIMTPDSFSPELMRTRRLVQEAAGEGCDVYTWNELHAAQYENFASTKILLLLVMLLIVLVASVNISSALVMLVMERRREIAILKSMGAAADGITAAFLLAGFSAGAAGVLFGLPLGLFASVNINTLISTMERLVNAGARCIFMLRHGDAASYTAIHLLDPAYYLQQIPVTVPFRELLLVVLGTLLLSLLVSALPAIRAGSEKPLDTLRKM